MVARSGMFVAPLAGSPPTGMSPTDGRIAFSALIGTTPQLASGGAITQSASIMAITVSPAVWQLPDVSNATGTSTFLSATDQFVVTPAAGPSTGSRIDLIVVKQNNVENSDADSRVNVVLVAGVAGAPGVAPAVPTGAYLYATVTVPTSAANSSACTIVIPRPSAFAPLSIRSNSLALLNQVTGTLGQHATVTGDTNNNGDYLWGTSWVTTGDKYLSCTRATSFSMTTNSTMFILMGSGATATGTQAPLWGAPVSHGALTNAAGVYSNETFQWDSNQGQLTVKVNGTYELEFRASGSPISAGTISIGITKNSTTIGSTVNDLARDDRANSSAVAQFLLARNCAVPVVTTDVIRFVSFILGAPGAVTFANGAMEGTFRILRVGA